MRVHLHAIAGSEAAAAELVAAACQGWQTVAQDELSSSFSAAQWPVASQVPTAGAAARAEFVPLSRRAPLAAPPLAPEVELVVAVTTLVDHNTGGPLDPSNLTALAADVAELAVPLVVIAGRCEAARREYASVPIQHVLSLSVDDVRPADGVETDVSPAAAREAAARIARTWSTGPRR
ncbi:MAG: hypothetical protein Q3999_03550 [Buchananella hordeovulneris]|nr:hypothetical protein [Buchananella hordeovulneris]